MANNPASQSVNPMIDISGKQVYVSDRPPRIKHPLNQHYNKIAVLTGKIGMNIFEVISGLSKPEQAFIIEISKKFTWKAFLVEVNFKGLTKAQKSNKYRAYSKLRKKDLVKRVDKNLYFINPKLLIPSDGNLEVEAKHLWDSIP